MLLIFGAVSAGLVSAAPDYQAATWDPIHFKPAIDSATDEQCLACHKEILEAKPLASSPAGVKASDTLAWYQTLDTYQGDQADVHWRHMKSPYSQKVMDLKCNTCHQGNDPREESVIPPDTAKTDFTLRKMVNPETTCLRCHGQQPSKLMGLPEGPWSEVGKSFGNDCLFCHATIRTSRHQVNYLKADEIEKLAKKDAQGSDVCYGCHGGRAWYRISYPYPRHSWKGMSQDVPEWAKNRPTESDTRFLKK